MRVALVSPEGDKAFAHNRIVPRLARRLRGVLRVMVDDRETIPNLALLCLAAHFPPATEFLLIDEDFRPSSSTLAAIDGFRPDLALVTAISHQAPRAFDLLAALRTRGIRSLFGGAWPTASPDAALEAADAVFTGEAERTLPAFLADLAAGTVGRLYAGAPDVDLAECPVPRYDLLESPEAISKFPLFATRGCPHDCAYCGITPIYGRRIRAKPVARVVAEVRAIKRIAPRPFLTFADENLFADPAYGEELLSALEPERVAFECYTDITLGRRPDLVARLRRAGCREVLIGLESIEPATLADESRFKRGMLDEYAACVEAIQAGGIPVFALFILGMDGDGPEVFDRTLEFCERSGVANAEFAALSPIPGTRTHARLAAEGRLMRDPAPRFEPHEYAPKRMTAAALERGILRLYARFHEPARAARRAARLKATLRRAAAAW